MKKVINLIISKPRLILVILVILIILLFSTIILVYFLIKTHSSYEKLEKEIFTLENRFELLSPSIAWMETEDFLAKQAKYNLNYGNLKQQVYNQILTAQNEKYGFYFEDLNTGSWIGINEREKFLPMSLFKLPVMMIILKKVQEGSLSLEQKIKILPEDLDSGSGNLYLKGAGYEITVKELITKMIQDSDNTASKILITRFVKENDYIDLIGLIGSMPSSEEISISPKEYTNMLRSLYYSTYLRRTFSELALTILLNTDFTSQLPAGIPNNIKISHKVGMGITNGFYHDCGIVYVPENPYMICIMGQNTTQEKADKMISTISRIVYNYVTENMEGD